MNRSRRLLPAIFFSLFCLGFIAKTARAELQLWCEFGDRSYPVAGVEKRQIYCRDGERKLPVPSDARWRIEGDLRSHAQLVLWAPSYLIVRPDRPDRESEQPLRANISLAHSTEAFGEKQESTFLKHWPDGVRDTAIVVLAWVAGGRPIFVDADPVGSTQLKHFHASASFQLNRDAAAGQGIALLWQEGTFVAPAPRFKDPAAENAFHATMLGDDAALRAALQKGVKARAVDRDEVPLLAYAAEAGAVGPIDTLLAAGARADDGRTKGAFPLLFAVVKGRTAAVERLIAAKANVDAEPGAPVPLHMAVRTGFDDIALKLIAAGADLEQLTVRRYSPLMLALEGGRAEVARSILARGTTFDFKNEQIARVLISQALLGHTGVVTLLLEKGGKLSADQSAEAIVAAAKTGDPALGRVLLNIPNASAARPAPNGTTPLMSAARHGQADFVRLLLDNGADVQAELGGRTALHFAVLSGNREVVELLLAAGAPFDRPDQKGSRPLDIALQCQAREIAALLVAKGAHVDVATKADLMLNVIALDLEPLLRAALADGWSSQTKFDENWPAAMVADACNARACATLLRRAAPAKAPPPFIPVHGRELDAPPRLVAARAPVDPRDIDEEYPAMLVEVEAVIDESGRVRFPRLTRSVAPLLALSTLDALRAWTFTPPQRGGKPVITRFTLPVEFPSSRDRWFELADVDQLPVPIKQVMPQFPAALQRARVSGEVYVRFVVNREGHTEFVRLKSSPDPTLGAEAVKAVEQWTYKPALRDGQPVNIRLEVPIVFKS